MAEPDGMKCQRTGIWGGRGGRKGLEESMANIENIYNFQVQNQVGVNGKNTFM